MTEITLDELKLFCNNYLRGRISIETGYTKILLYETTGEIYLETKQNYEILLIHLYPGELEKALLYLKNKEFDKDLENLLNEPKNI